MTTPGLQAPPVPTAQAPMAQLIDPAGARRPDHDLDPWVADVDDDALVALHRDMTVVRRIDAEATALQRQGELALWPPLAGQEAAQIGAARALEDHDFAFTSYREHGIAWCRGVRPDELLSVWRGSAPSGWDPYARNLAVPQIIIGAQALHATGYAMGLRWDGSDAASLACIGDGATSEGDVSEAMVFAASFRAPVVFLCQNNHWAISEPVGLQSAQAIARRADGFGMPGVRVDGNDVLAVLAVTRRALARARAGDGPTFIEAVTYRLGPHTTADDPTRYRTETEVSEWRERDPIARVLARLGASGLDRDAVAREAEAEADRVAAELRATISQVPDPAPLDVFAHVYAGPNSHLDRQRDRYARYLAMYDDALGDEGLDDEGGSR